MAKTKKPVGRMEKLRTDIGQLEKEIKKAATAAVRMKKKAEKAARELAAEKSKAEKLAKQLAERLAKYRNRMREEERKVIKTAESSTRAAKEKVLAAFRTQIKKMRESIDSF